MLGLMTKIAVFALIAGVTLSGLLAVGWSEAQAGSTTETLSVTVQGQAVCDVLTPESIYDEIGWGRRMRLWKMFIFCTAGENYLLALNAINEEDLLKFGSEGLNTDIALETIDGSGTGEWEPLVLRGDYIGSQFSYSDIFQLTLIY